jgi:hypothetical protein
MVSYARVATGTLARPSAALLAGATIRQIGSRQKSKRELYLEQNPNQAGRNGPECKSLRCVIYGRNCGRHK